jgi:hypothetical protein
MGRLDFDLVIIGGSLAGLCTPRAAAPCYVDILRALSRAE